MKNRIGIIFLTNILVCAVLLVMNSCRKDECDTCIIYGGGVADIDGNQYITVVIGTQEWMAENLMTTRYSNGSDIPNVPDQTEWQSLTWGAYAISPHTEIDGLGSDTEVLQAYGALYNWYAVRTGKLCPLGWRVATDDDWKTLTDYLGGENLAGGKLKSTATEPDAHPRWESPNAGATNDHGFSALPSGNLLYDSFHGVGKYARWWTSTQNQVVYPSAWYYALYYHSSLISSYSLPLDYGLSVRCVKE